jgi:acyl-CoA synthetase (AMP-forming)/AMP-acid ligase II
MRNRKVYSGILKLKNLCFQWFDTKDLGYFDSNGEFYII